MIRSLFWLLFRKAQMKLMRTCPPHRFTEHPFCNICGIREELVEQPDRRYGA